jgi:ABC-type transporter Mla subunit MlaD
VVAETIAEPSRAQRLKSRLRLIAGTYKDRRVLAAQLLQLAGFVVLVRVFFNGSQPSLPVVLSYLVPTVLMVKGLQYKVYRERAAAAAENA